MPAKVKLAVVEKPKPEPPQDLWAQLEQAIEEVRSAPRPRPEGSFTIHEFAAGLKITMTTARRRLDLLRKAGRVKRVGSMPHKGQLAYYILSDGK